MCLGLVVVFPTSPDLSLFKIRCSVYSTAMACGGQVFLEVQQALKVLHEVDSVLEQLALFWANSEVNNRMRCTINVQTMTCTRYPV